MKHFKTILILMTLALAFTGCSDSKDKRGEINGRYQRGGEHYQNNGGAGGGTHPEPSNGTSWGVITGQPQDKFDQAIMSLASGTIDPQSSARLTRVSGTAGGETGVVFFGDFPTESGAFNPNGTTSAKLSSRSVFHLEIWDVTATETNEPFIISNYKGGPGRAWGQVNGNQATIYFEDDVGVLELRGSFDANEFTGTVTFENKTYWDGLRDGETSGAKGTLGTFQVETCGFFLCQ